MNRLFMNCLVLSFLIGFTVMIIYPASADLIFPIAEQQFTVSNTENYHGYLFLTRGPGDSGENIVLGPGVSVHFDQHVTNLDVYAVRKNGRNTSPGMITQGQLDSLLSDKSLLIGPVSIKRYSTANPGRMAGVRDTYRIISLDETGFSLERMERILRYTDGTEEAVSPEYDDSGYRPVVWWTDDASDTGRVTTETAVSFSPNTVPATVVAIPATDLSGDTEPPDPYAMYEYLAIPLLAGIVIIAIFISRRRRH